LNEAVFTLRLFTRKYFGKSASGLDPAESALLAAMIPNPIARNPYKSNPKLQKKKNWLLKLMWKTGKISKFQYDSAVQERILLR
jgi:membrane peptidoglycan carboxypeptidase